MEKEAMTGKIMGTQTLMEQGYPDSSHRGLVKGHRKFVEGV